MRLDRRKFLGPLFKPLSRVKHSRASRILNATLWLPSQLIRARQNRPYFVVNIASRNGMGALLSEAILMSAYAESRNLIPVITSSNPLYSIGLGDDCLALYFEPMNQYELPYNLKPMRFHTLWSFYHLNFPRHIAIEQANRLFKIYFSPKPIIKERVDLVLRQIQGGQFDLSIHYRGTDKALEAPLVKYETFADAIRRYQGMIDGLGSVFLATDDSKFEEFIQQAFPAIEFITYKLGEPLDASRGRHFSDMRPEDKAIEAIVNMFLIASSKFCIRSSSYLSAISKIINPDLRTQTLNVTHWGSTEFPEYEVNESER
jgi:hypothetical protein